MDNENVCELISATDLVIKLARGYRQVEDPNEHLFANEKVYFASVKRDGEEFNVYIVEGAW